MKRPYLPIIAASILIGICIGWVMKSAGAPSETAGNQQPPEQNAAVPTKAAIREELPKTPRPKPPRPEAKPEAPEAKNTFSFEVVQPGGEVDEKTRAMLEQMDAEMNRRRENEDNAKVAEMVAKYGLTPEQEEKLRAHFASRREQIAGLMSGKAVPNVMDLLSGDGFDEFAQTELTDEQKQLYEEEKVAAQTPKVESTALKNLAALTDLVGLRPEQRDAAYEVLHNRAQSNPTQESSLGGVVDGIVGGLRSQMIWRLGRK